MAQIYEDYWRYTAAYTDLNGQEFINILKACVLYFQHTQLQNLSYEDLQKRVAATHPMDEPSVRKAINQLVKLGFLIPQMGGYHKEALAYINAVNDNQRKNALSKAVYKYANMDASMTKMSRAAQGHLNFLLKTLEEVGCLSDKEIMALMTVDLSTEPKGYLTREEVDKYYALAAADGFADRKYNQIYHLKNLLGKLNDLVVHDGSIYFAKDANRIFGDNLNARKECRDPFLQRVYKEELEEETKLKFNSRTPRCMLEGLDHPVLIASHIKPYISSDENEAFDANNGLLLSKNLDSLFDLGYITFDEHGYVIPADTLSAAMREYVSQYHLSEIFINDQRMAYMEYHRTYIFDKRFARKA